MGPLYTAKVGGSHEQESKSLGRLLILLEKKSQKRCGSSERGTSDGRGALRDFPNTSISNTFLLVDLPMKYDDDNPMTEMGERWRGVREIGGGGEGRGGG